MRAGLGQIRQASPEYLLFAQQYGMNDIVFNTPDIPGHDGTWAVHDLVNLRRNVENYGLTLSALENVPTTFYDHIMLNGPKRDEQVDNMITTVRNIARAGIPIFGYHWMPTLVGRTSLTTEIRSGARVTAFDLIQAEKDPLLMDRRYTENEMWENLEHWIKIIVPVAT